MARSSNAASDFDYMGGLPQSTTDELQRRFDELDRLEKEQVEIGTTVPQLYGSLSKFIANPSTVSVETYKRMLDTDETLGSGIDFTNLSMMARWGEYKHPSQEITDFVQRALGGMEGSWHENLEEMLSAEWAGFSVTEQVWKAGEDTMGIPAFVPKKLVTYPPLTVVFAVDRQGNLLPDGIYQYQRYYNSFFSSFAAGLHVVGEDGFRPDLFAAQGDFPYPIRLAADLSYLTVKIPRHKCIHLRSSSTGKFNNPYGRSILRRAYKNWVIKDAFLKMWVIGADRKGTPLIVGYAAPNDTVHSQAQGAAGAQGEPKEERADHAMARILKTIHNQSAIVLPGRKGEIYDIESVPIQGDMNVFKEGALYCNQMLMRALLLPPMVMGGGDGGGNYSLADNHTKIFEKSVDGKLKVHKQGVLEQLVQKIISYNFPESAWKKDGYGEFKLEEYDTELMEKLSNVYRNLTETGYMTPEAQVDMDDVRSKMNLSKKAANLPMPEMPLEAEPGAESAAAPSGEEKRSGKQPEFGM
jgi:hypothetical protein